MSIFFYKTSLLLTLYLLACSKNQLPVEVKDYKSTDKTKHANNNNDNRKKSDPKRSDDGEKKNDDTLENNSKDEENLGNDKNGDQSGDNEVVDLPEIRNTDEDEYSECTATSLLVLNLRVHLMRGIEMEHSGVLMTSDHITPDMVKNEIINEVNTIYSQANISFRLENIIEENAIKDDSYESNIRVVLNAKRDEDGRSDPARLPPLYKMMNPINLSSEDQLDSNLFHIYLFPFIGNTSQGNAMRSFGFHSVVGVWTNKHNGGSTPEKTKIVGSNNNGRGSLSRTIAHEISHVLNLSHTGCTSQDSFNCLMNGSTGTDLNESEILTLRSFAMMRQALCKN
ncbi:MAG: M12 family metallo-peptidase [Oligoflexales bacterium]